MNKTPPWYKDSLCKDLPTKLWYQFDAEKDKFAKKICNRCPVRTQCLQFALDNHETGVWGGLNDMDRKRLRRKAYVQAALEESLRRNRRRGRERPANESPVYLLGISFPRTQTLQASPTVAALRVTFPTSYIG
jgi:WhiB family redox-sensing transcriptional regulator